MKILELVLYTRDIKSITAFYGGTLSFLIQDQGENFVIFQVGNSKLHFIYRENSQPYHFAFNIPHNKTNEALTWLKDRVDVWKHEDSDIIDFDSWHAKAIYFYDTDKNIVEFIARAKLDNASVDSFDQNSLCGISEIGIVSTPIAEIVEQLKTEFNLPLFQYPSASFTAVGDDNGLFICIDPTLKKWFPMMDEAFSAPFSASLLLGGEIKEYNFKT